MMVAILLAVSAIAADEAAIQEFIATIEAGQPAKVAEFERQIRGRRVQIAKRQRDPKQLGKETEALVEKIKRLKSFDLACLLICDAEWPDKGPVGAIGRGGFSIPVTQIIDENNMLAGYVGRKEYWIRKPTVGLVTGSNVSMPDFVRAATAQFGGTTYPVYESVTEAVIEAWNKHHPPQNAKP